MDSEVVLSVRNLETEFLTDSGPVQVLHGVSFDVKKGRTLGLVGESGCGKSVTSMSIMGLLPKPYGRIIGGEILYRGKNLAALPAQEMYAMRGDRISIIFQDPMTALNPVHTVGKQLMEVLKLHRPELSRSERRSHALEMLKKVHIPMPEKRLDEYPHNLSGGMRQRVMIAMALACKPEILICDEPTTALDVTVQASILDLINELQQETGMAVVFITHDLGVVAEICDDVAVMYAGKIVEYADVFDLFDAPKHPYTERLMGLMPSLEHAPKQLIEIKPIDISKFPEFRG
ncbi:peptide ABC transporter ATP-binding protein [Vibrio cidicii]|uniref:ABC-type dipeptide transporter n=1 Tax=Vibrio cidicii TaxID=1763883 RepID=A0A151KX39_9VIBR|nr:MULTISPECIES: ABC transporter ATP-binding protein [Vibrio]EJL6398508.1 ABC transporter ATP-binding protein [Vibrio navarrensis]EJL6565280.1 ABC transporter ATP-binding protein [Vibrio navarrensis]KGK21138.1 peptide ABC transporter ATP-binding protein [Vibrio navarrensis]KYN87962.1 peptide ABC transporter ATP-binding protein [Vibrio cidicii]KYN88553.1 peptide ABC transporter ATP-binding protein [Vibrio cidicii]